MGLFDFLRQPDVNQGVNDYKNSTGAVLLDVRTPEEYSDGVILALISLAFEQMCGGSVWEYRFGGKCKMIGGK